MDSKNLRVNLPIGEYLKILNSAKAVYPEEACGLIAGVDEGGVRAIKKVYVLENVEHSEEHFSLNLKEQLNAIKDMRNSGLKPLGNWHSHPFSPSRPSKEDIRLAFDKKASYLILSLKESEPVLNAFHIENGESIKEILEITE